MEGSSWGRIVSVIGRERKALTPDGPAASRARPRTRAADPSGGTAEWASCGFGLKVCGPRDDQASTRPSLKEPEDPLMKLEPKTRKRVSHEETLALWKKYRETND